MDCEWFAGMIDRVLNVHFVVQTKRVVTGLRRRIRGRARLETEIQDFCMHDSISHRGQVVSFAVICIYYFGFGGATSRDISFRVCLTSRTCSNLSDVVVISIDNKRLGYVYILINIKRDEEMRLCL